MTDSTTRSTTISQGDVLFIGVQIQNDLYALSDAYPTALTRDRVRELFSAYTNFMFHQAVDKIGFSIVDPSARNLVYHEMEYSVLYGSTVVAMNPSGAMSGKGGNKINPAVASRELRFFPWLVWSATMKHLPIEQQREIVADTGWEIPSASLVFERTFDHGDTLDGGYYTKGMLGVHKRVYRRNEQ